MSARLSDFCVSAFLHSRAQQICFRMTFAMKLKILRAFYKVPLLEGARIRRCALLLHEAPLIRARFPLQAAKRAWRGFRRCGRTPLEFALAPRPYLKLWPKQTNIEKKDVQWRQPRLARAFCFLVQLSMPVAHVRASALYVSSSPRALSPHCSFYLDKPREIFGSFG